MKCIETKINKIIDCKYKDQKIIFKLTSRVPFIDYPLLIIPASGIIIPLLYLVIRGNLWISRTNEDTILNFLTYLGIFGVSIILMLWGFIWLNNDYNSYLVTEEQIVRLRSFNVMIKRDPHLDEIKFNVIGFITFKEKKHLLKGIKIYERDDKFPSLSMDTEKVKSELDLLEENLKKFQIRFNIKRDGDISKKVLNFLIQEANLERHPILRDVYFANI